VAFLLATAWALLGTPAALAAPPAKILFPVVGTVSYENDFGDPRHQGSHAGNDILADWRAPVVAVEAGRVRVHTTSRNAGCMLYLYGKSGTTYLYIHLNNDLGPDNDNSGSCKPGTAYAPGLRDGQSVRAGQLIGYVGNSGDADGAPHHLHFELHPNGVAAVSPYRWLKRANKLLFAAPEQAGGRNAASTLDLTLIGTVVDVTPAEPAAEGPSEPAPAESEGGSAKDDPKPEAGSKPGEDPPPPPPPPSERKLAKGEAAGALLTIRVTTVRLSGGERWRVTKRVTVFVPAGTLAERSGGGTVELSKLEGGAKLTVAASASLSLDAQLGRPGVLRAAQIVLR
jgi:hypothetical protein